MELIGGAVLMMLGGGLLTSAALPARRSAIENARAVLGDSDGAVTRVIPPSWRELLARLD